MSPSYRHLVRTLRAWGASRLQLQEARVRWCFSGARYGLYSVPGVLRFGQMVGGP